MPEVPFLSYPVIIVHRLPSHGVVCVCYLACYCAFLLSTVHAWADVFCIYVCQSTECVSLQLVINVCPVTKIEHM